jgi:hypothetical protein
VKVGLASLPFVIVATGGFIIGRQAWDLGKLALVGVAVLAATLGITALLAVTLRSFLALGVPEERSPSPREAH